MKGSKKILIIAGPNGAGKTTYAREYLLNEADCPVFVNADQIAAGIAPDAPETAAVQAGRLMLEKIDALVAEGASFALETTLSGRGYVRKIAKWRMAGYHVALHFLSLQTPEDAIRRVAERVRHGGHHIPTDVIRRRFHAGLENFRKIYAQCVDSWILYDNNPKELVVLDSQINDEIS